MTNQEELFRVRDLARKYMEVAQSEEMRIRRRRWRNVYEAKRPDRPPIICHGGAANFSFEKDLKCADRLCRALERYFTGKLSAQALGDDSICYPYYPLLINQWSFQWDWGVEFKESNPETPGASNLYVDPPIKDETDLAKIRLPDVAGTLNQKKAALAEPQRQCEEILQGIIPVKIVVSYSSALAYLASRMMGLDTLMINMAEKPDFVHALMRRLQQFELQILDALDRAAMFSAESNCHLNSGGILYAECVKSTPADVPVRVYDLWGRTESQEFHLVSPAMTRMFLLEYQKPILSRFKYAHYGCCESLTQKLDDILTIPNLRAVVNSPWTDLETMVEKCKDRYCIIWRQPFSEIMFAKNDNTVRADVERGLRLTRGCCRAVFCEEVNWAMVKDPQHRVKTWIQAAKNAAEKYAN